MTKTRDLSDFLIEGGADLPLGKPHIVPGLLYPSYVASGTSNKLLDGTTDHSGAFGTEQSDGRKYYYTNIAGSKPIKDPRIGGHFGSQRYRFSSVQLLEQETATHGSDVHSIDGREWIRRVGSNWTYVNANQGVWFHSDNSIATNSEFIEITGYFNAANWITLTDSANDLNISIDGTANSSTFSSGTTAVTSPLVNRFVNATSVISIPFDSTPTLGIHTLKLSNVNGDYLRIYGVELIAQDTTSTANRSKIQIPAQNVVSFGKKFPISATAVHYDPFSVKTDGSAWTSPTSGTNNANSAASWPTNIDTAHSLGLDKWVDGSSYYRPYNGGRVVKYVDSTGTIKTAVTMMPPNAKSIKSADVNKKAKNAPNDTYLPTFEDETTDVNEDNLHEVAKTFHFREFGNGAANGGDLATYADASMLHTSDDIAYVMDDGLTSFSGDDTGSTGAANSGFYQNASGKKGYITFIGTGFRLNNNNSNVTDTAQCSVDGVQIQNAVSSASPEAQNLPFGTHIVTENWVTAGGSTPTFDEFTFYQPKRPPIPKDACVLADYMLMADFVQVTQDGNSYISKGVRRCDSSRDVFYNNDSGNSPSFNHWSNSDLQYSVNNMRVYIGASHADAEARMTAFCTNMVHYGWQLETRYQTYEVDTGSGYSAQTVGKDGTSGGSYYNNSAK